MIKERLVGCNRRKGCRTEKSRGLEDGNSRASCKDEKSRCVKQSHRENACVQVPQAAEMRFVLE